MPNKGPHIVLRHEYSGCDAEEIQAGLRAWAVFIAERLRQSSRGDVGNVTKREGRPA